MARKTSAEVAGNWNIQRGNTVRYTAESQISFQLRRRLAGNMARSFANHFARRTVYIGSRNPSQHTAAGFLLTETSLTSILLSIEGVLDEELLNSAVYGADLGTTGEWAKEENRFFFLFLRHSLFGVFLYQ